jgi:hypothetical protein
MEAGAFWFIRRSILVAVVGVLAVVLTACTAHGGGYLPAGPSASDAFPATVFTDRASFAFNFSCEDNGGVNPRTGQLRGQLTYVDHGSSLLLGSPFSIHGTVDILDPVLESAICIGQNPPPGGNELIFLGRYRPTSSVPAGFATSCPTSESAATPLCRFEVTVRDNDGDQAPSARDYFQIQLSSSAPSDADLVDVGSTLDDTTVFYARAGLLQGGNLSVD